MGGFLSVKQNEDSEQVKVKKTKAYAYMSRTKNIDIAELDRRAKAIEWFKRKPYEVKGYGKNS